MSFDRSLSTAAAALSEVKVVAPSLTRGDDSNDRFDSSTGFA
jgi:hypothetical protein